MREYIIALKIKLPSNMTPEKWLNNKIGSAKLAGVEVHYEEITDESKTKSRPKPRSSGETAKNSNKAQD